VPDASDYKIGKAFDIAELRKPARVREPSPRDIAITKAINAAATSPASQVVPLSLPESDKLGTAKAAAVRIIRSNGSPVHVGVSAQYPNTLLFSRGVLSNRGRKARA
jgi:hypothetical protein